MTSSETPTDDADPAELPTAIALEREEEQPRAVTDPDRWVRAAVIAGAIVVGWGFIAWTHNLRLTAAVVFLCLGWFAVVLGVNFLWRTGSATSDNLEEVGWWRPTGAREELEREKRALLKAIKEVDFDHQTGKMSAKDAEAISRGYRARAIEVIKAMDELEAGASHSVREQIDREVKARLALDAEAKKAEAARAKRVAAGSAKKPRPEPTAEKKPGAGKPGAGKKKSDSRRVAADDKPAAAAGSPDDAATKRSEAS